MKALRTHTDHAKEIAYIRELTDAVAEAERVLRERLHETAGDGHPTRSGPSGSRPRGGHGDPVADFVMSRIHGDERDPIREALAKVLTLTREARQSLETARSVSLAALAPKIVHTDTEDLWCVSCARANICNPALRAGRCQRCADWRAANGDDIIPALIRELDKGQRMTVRLVHRFYPDSSPVFGRDAR